VFLVPLETQFDEPRSTVALTYSLALVALTVSVLFGPRFFGRWSAATILLTACALAAGGTLLAGAAGSLPIVWLGYSLIFGAANGLGYGFGLQIAAQANPGSEGSAMGIVTASYALGAVLSPGLFAIAIEAQGFASAMMALAVALIGSGLISAALMRTVNARFELPEHSVTQMTVPLRSQQLLWLGYFGGVLAGLMVIGHAAGIVASLRPGLTPWIAPVVIASCNLVGSLAAGRLTDKFPPGALLASLSLLTFVALVSSVIFGRTFGVMISFGVVGFAYGGTIAAYPAAIAKLFGMRNSARIYGRVFTAWGCAGLVGPWFAGFLFDWSGDYRLAIIAAAAFAVISTIMVAILFRNGHLTYE